MSLLLQSCFARMAQAREISGNDPRGLLLKKLQKLGAQTILLNVFMEAKGIVILQPQVKIWDPDIQSQNSRKDPLSF